MWYCDKLSRALKQSGAGWHVFKLERPHELRGSIKCYQSCKHRERTPIV